MIPRMVIRWWWGSAINFTNSSQRHALIRFLNPANSWEHDGEIRSLTDDIAIAEWGHSSSWKTPTRCLRPLKKSSIRQWFLTIAFCRRFDSITSHCPNRQLDDIPDIVYQRLSILHSMHWTTCQLLCIWPCLDVNRDKSTRPKDYVSQSAAEELARSMS